MKRSALILFALVMVPVVVFANSHPNLERGLVPGSMMRMSGPDNVNLFNGNLSLSIPLGQSYPVSDTLSYSFVLRYNSNVWDFVTRTDHDDNDWVQAHPAFFSNAGLGWQLSLGDLLAPGSPRDYGNPASAWVYVSPDGSSHRFYGSLHEGESPGGGRYTRDGSYLRMNVVELNDMDDPVKITVETPSGNVHTFELDLDQGWELWRLTEIRDQFDNSVSITYSFPWGRETGGLECEITDSTGRTHSLSFERYAVTDPLPRYRLTELRLAAFGEDLEACYDFEYTVETIPRSPKHDDDTYMDPTVTVPLLQTVTYPDGTTDPCGIDACSGCSTTDFSYILTGDYSGRAEYMRLPTGGEIEWEYGSYQYPAGNTFCGYQDQPWNYDIVGSSAGVISRTLDADPVNKKWTYFPEPTVSYGDISVFRNVISPDGTLVTHYFNTGVERCDDSGDWRGWAYGLPFDPDVATSAFGLSTAVYAPNSYTSPIRKNYVRYEHDQLPTPGVGHSPHYWYNTNRRVAFRNTLYYDDMFTDPYVPRNESVTYSNFDGLGHYREASFEGTFDDEPERHEFTGFNPAQGGAYYEYLVDYSAQDYNDLDGDFPISGYPLDAEWILGTFDLQSTELGTAPDPIEENRVEYCTERVPAGDYFLSPTTGFLKGLRIHVDEDPATDDRSTEDIIKRFFESLASPGRVGTEKYYGAETQAIPTDQACDVDGFDAEYKVNHLYSYGVLSRSSYEIDPPVEGGILQLFTRNIDNNTGLTITENDTSGYSTTFDYDLLGRLTEAAPTDGAKTTLTYTPASGSGVDLVKATVHQQSIDQDSPYPVLAESKFTFDAFGRGEKESHLLADGTWNQRVSAYDALDRLTWVTEWQPDGTTAGNYSKTEYSDFDAFGRVGTVTLPDGHQIVHAYTGRRLVDRTAWVGTTFDGVDAVTEEPTTTKTTLDRSGRPLKVEEPSGANGVVVPTDYRYDVAGNLKWAQITAAGTTQIREFDYNGLGFLASSSIPEKSVDTTYSDYDPLGNVGRIDDGLPSDLSYGYDFASRLKTISDNIAGEQVGSFSYYGDGSDPELRGGGTYSDGKLATATRTNLFDAGAPWDKVDVTETNEYDGIGGGVSRKQTDITLGTGTTPESFEQEWTYNDLGQVATTTYPEEVGVPSTLPDLVVTNGFSNGWLTSVTPGVEEITYYANGMLELVNYHTFFMGSRGIAFDRDPDWMQRPQELHFIGWPFVNKGAEGSTTDSGDPQKSTYPGCYWKSGEFSYDGLGNLTAQAGYDFLDGFSGGDRFYEYDKVNRLKTLTSTTDDPQPGFSYQAAYQYDAFGNMISQTLGGDTYTYEVDTATNQISGLSYDTAGNQLGWAGYTYEYTPFHQILEYSAGGRTQYYAYAADNERVVVYDSAVPETSFALRDLDTKVLRALRLGVSEPEWERDYLYRGRTLVGAKSPESDFRLFVDHLGSVRLVTGWSEWGAIVEVNNYTPFGSEWTSDVLGTDQKLRFTGHERDLMNPTHTTDDVDYMHARHYNLNLARFLSVDPVGGDPSRPQSWNAYAYVLNNPLKFTDPFGLSEADKMRNSCADGAPGDTACGSEQDFKKIRAQLWLVAQRFGLKGVDLNKAARTAQEQAISYIKTGSVINLSSEPIVVSGNNPDGEGQLTASIPPWTWSRYTELPFANNDVDTVIYGDDAIKIYGRPVGPWISLPEILRPASYRGLNGNLLRFGPVSPIFSLTIPSKRDPSMTEFQYQFGPLVF